MSDRWLYAWGVGSVAFGGASLLVPLYIVSLGATPFDLGLLAALAALIGAPSAILFGRVGNRVEWRRTLVILTLTAVGLLLALMPFISSIPGVILLNGILWLFVAGVSPVLTVIVVDSQPESAWPTRIGQLNSFQGYGWATGLLIGVLWPVLIHRLVSVEDAIRILFGVFAIAALVSALGARRMFPDPEESTGSIDPHSARRIGRLLDRSRFGVRGATMMLSPNRLYWTTRDLRPRRIVERMTRPFRLYLVSSMLFFTGFAAFWAPLPLYLTEVGFSSDQIFAIYLVSSLGSAVLYSRAGRLSSLLNLRVLQSGALAVRGGLFVLVVLVGALSSQLIQFGGVLLTLTAIGATWAIIAVAGTTIVTRLSRSISRSDALGLYTAIAAVSGGGGGLIGGWLATFSYLLAFTVAGGIVVGGAVLVLTIRDISSG